MNPRRLLRAAILAIILGVATTLAFAWVVPIALAGTGLAHPAPWSPDRFWIDDTRGGHYQVTSQPFIAATHFQHIIFEGRPSEQKYYKQDPPPAWAYTLLHSTRGEAPADTREWWSVDTFVSGWPFRAFRGGEYEPWPSPPGATSSPLSSIPFRVGLYRFGGPAGDRFVIPLRPIARGLALNILFFSTEWITLFVIAGLGRAWLRFRRGHCPMCNYDCRGLAPGSPCPECGWKNPMPGAM